MLRMEPEKSCIFVRNPESAISPMRRLSPDESSTPDCRRMLQPASLIGNTADYVRVAMSHTEGKDAAEEIQILAAVRIHHATPEALRQNYWFFVIVGDTRKEKFLVLRANGGRIHVIIDR